MNAVSPDVHLSLPDTGARIDGRPRPAEDGRTYVSVNPANEAPIVEVADCSVQDVDDAVAAARRSFKDGRWSRLPGRERGIILNRLADLLAERAPELAALETAEMGKLYGLTVHGDVPASIESWRYYAGMADKLFGHTSALPEFGPFRRFGYTVREPAGVVGAILPWNNPLLIAAWKLAPALAAGCSAVVKPAEDAALSILGLADLAAEAGVPDGVLNVVPGVGDRAGVALAQHGDLDVLSFTGSPEVGRMMPAVAGDKFRRLVLELGGKSPQLVFDDADLASRMGLIAAGNFFHQGQVCAAGTRVLVHERVLDEVVEGLRTAGENSVIGDPFDEATTQGSIVNETQLQRILGYIEAGRSQGATLVTGGSRVDREGYFVEPTVFVGTNDLRIAREEIFGPVATVIPFRTEEEALALANDTRYGLAAIIYTQDVSRVQRLVPDLKAGMVWVNGWGAPDPSIPWGGNDMSGLGRELGPQAMDDVTRERSTHIYF